MVGGGKMEFVQPDYTRKGRDGQVRAKSEGAGSLFTVYCLLSSNPLTVPLPRGRISPLSPATTPRGAMSELVEGARLEIV